MAKSKSKRQSNGDNPPQNDIELLKSDVASFASSLGLSSSSSGFNDTDFRKSGPLKPLKKPAPDKPRSDVATTRNDSFGGKQAKKKPAPDKPRNDVATTRNDSFSSKHGKKKPAPDKPRNDVATTRNDSFGRKHAKPNSKLKPKVLSLDDSKSWKIDKFKDLPKLPLMNASSLGVWHQDAVELESKVLGEGTERLKLGEVAQRGVGGWQGMVEKKREVAERLMAQYVLDYEMGRGKSGDVKMLIATQRSGTAADKVSAFSVLVGDNPVANLRSLDALLGMVTSKVGKRHSLTGFEALKELFVTSLLPDRKLKTLLQQPLNKLPESKNGYSLLLFWYFEECLKQRYERFVFALEEASRDMLPVLKDKALKTTYGLLKSKPEQERRLLSALVNKLGDPQNKSASNADFHLSNLLSDHPSMKSVVINEVDIFLFRPHLGLRAKYHAINFLSQIRLTHIGDGPNVAKRLIDIYFALFKVLITEAGNNENKNSKAQDEKPSGNSDKINKAKSSSDSHVELDSRLLSALLTGINRAFPYVASTEADDIIEVQTPMLFQLVHSKNFNVGVQALMLLDKISSKNQIVSDRFYRALYSKLLLPAAMHSSKAEMFIGLLLRAIKSDVNLKRVCAFSKRLLQVALQQPPQYACGCLFLLSEVLKAKPPLWSMVLQSESIDSDIEHFEDIEETDNEPPTPSKKEETNDEVALADHQDRANSNSDALEDEDDSPEDMDDSSASYSEHDSDEAEGLLLNNDSKDLSESRRLPCADGLEIQVSATKPTLPGGYDPRHREPSYCNADRSSWWELTVLASHVHPSVATMAGTLLSGANIVYNGNPLNDLSMSAFLDKFMEKKPKQNTWHGGSQIEPAKKLDMNNHLLGPEILSLAEMDVPPEDLVFHKFYTNKMNSTKKLKKKKKKEAEEEEAAEEFVGMDGGDVSDDEEIDNMLDSTDLSFEEANGEYDYDDLDKMADDDDEELVGDVSDAEMDIPSDTAEGSEGDFEAIPDNVSVDSDGDDDVNIGDADDDSEAGDDFNLKKRKQKSGGKVGASPFASLEDYAHLLNEDSSPPEKGSRGEKRSKSRSKKRSSSSSSSSSSSGDGPKLQESGRKRKKKTQKGKGKKPSE
ncbi:CCAAT/enhancer-binding protein zeta [Tripterygium wilfordii]|uniref:CCAAT/enhancer-binding protein zeta n=1 Tax=Tripterygium wilfordii TaxID=458696 RepID=UPI0018F85C8A|nr:CCAAT/enhancer-binding protein zeta [Tripterygium wilfordii]